MTKLIFVLMLTSLLYSQAQAASGCFIATKKNPVNLEACLSLPDVKYVESEIPTLSARDILEGPEAIRNFTADSEVYCYFRTHRKSQLSPKFRCFRTTGNGFGSSNYRPEFYNKDGAVVPAAVTVGLEGTPVQDKLLDANSQPVLDANGAPEIGDEIKVKYFNGGALSKDDPNYFIGARFITNPRESEEFSETAATRLFWALGMPADKMSVVGKVHCYGCSGTPFEQTEFLPGKTATFFDVAIERKRKGKGLAETWSWSDVVTNHYPQYSQQTKIDFEALVLAGQLISFHSDLSQQNRVDCDQLNPETKECFAPVVMINDLGSTWGGKAKIFFKQAPRGNLEKYVDHSGAGPGKVFKDSQCNVVYPLGGFSRISAAGLEAFKARLKNLNHDSIRNIFLAAKFGRVQPEVTAQMGGEDKVIDAWTAELEARVNGLRNTSCP